MLTIALIGPTGSGKTRLLRDLLKGNRAHVIDPLGPPARAVTDWEPPEAPADAVVIDHAHYLSSGGEGIGQAAAWCRKHNANLILVGMSQQEVEHLVPDASLDTVIELTGSPKKGSITISSESSESIEKFWARSAQRLPQGAKPALQNSLLG